MKYAGTIASLLLTAALFLALPGLTIDQNRVAEPLQIPELTTLTVWLCPDGPADRKALNAAAAAFEKANRGLRVFIRRVTVDELDAQSAILPDVLLFATGEITRTEKLLPLDASHPSGMSAGTAYAAPLWYAPACLSYPESWGDDPWPMINQLGALKLPEGVALQQLMLSGYQPVPAAPSPTPSAPKDGVSPARGRTPTPIPTITQQAQVVYGKPDGPHIPLSPETSDCVRYAALCRESDPARDFLTFLMAFEPENLTRVGENTLLPNAFAHTRQEIRELCLHAYIQQADPAQTLLRLR